MKQYVAILYMIKTYDTLLQWKIKQTNKQIHNHEYKNCIYVIKKKPHMSKERQKKKDGTNIYNKTCHEVYWQQKALYNNVYNINHLSSHKNIN